MCEQDINDYLEPVEFLFDLRDAGYDVYPTERGVLACPPAGVVMPAEMRFTLYRTEPFVRDLLVHEGAPILSDAEAARVAANPAAAEAYRSQGRGARRRMVLRRRLRSASDPVPCQCWRTTPAW